MKAEIKALTGRVLVLEVAQADLQIIRDLYDELNGQPVNLEMKKFREKRSLDSNSYMWVLIGKLSQKINIPPEVIYQEYIRDIGDYEIFCMKEEVAERFDQLWTDKHIGRITETFPSKLEGCLCVKAYRGSSEFDTAQMSRLIDLVIADCKENHIETMTPEELSILKENWI